VNRSVSVRVGIDKLNALQTRGAIVDGTQVMGTRGSASATVSVPGVASASAASDATRGGRSFTVGQGCSIY